MHYIHQRHDEIARDSHPVSLRHDSAASRAGASLQVSPGELNAGKCDNSTILITNYLKPVKLYGKQIWYKSL